MGQRFYEATMPKIADQLERLNSNIGIFARSGDEVGGVIEVRAA